MSPHEEKSIEKETVTKLNKFRPPGNVSNNFDHKRTKTISDNNIQFHVMFLVTELPCGKKHF